MTLGLVLGGVTAIPLQTELDVAARVLKVSDLAPAQAGSSFVKWLLTVGEAVPHTNAKFPLMAYGTDWLGFALVVLGMAFHGAVRHTLRHAWMFNVGIIASVLVIPWALVLGELRGIPMGWRLVDRAFGVVGFIPLCGRVAFVA